MRIRLASIALALVVLASPLAAGTLRVGDFGARGDGWTDDTHALQQALDALRSGDALHFDSGRGGSYSYSEGDWPMAGINIEPNRGSVVPGAKGVSIRGARIVGNKGFGVAASVARPENILIERNYFSDNAQGGVRISGRGMTVQKNLFEGFQRAITSMAYGGRLNTATRGIIDVTANRENRDARVVSNTFRNIRAGKAIVYVHHLAGDEAQIRDNCFQQFVVPTIASGKRSGITIVDNAENPSQGCPDPRGW